MCVMIFQCVGMIYTVVESIIECVDGCKDDISECVWTHCINEVLYYTECC